jgi:hypothetical protein
MTEIPMFFQPRTKPYCGHACAKMVLAYHGIDMSLRSILHRMPDPRNRVTPFSLGIFFLEQDFDVIIKVWLPEWPSSFWCNDDAFEKQLTRWCKRELANPSPDRLVHRVVIPEFLEEGGQIIPSPVSLQDIEESLMPDPETGMASPCILNVGVYNIYQKRTRIGHYVVTVHIDSEFIKVNDPNSFRGGAAMPYPISSLMHACYTWASAAIFPVPKKRA